MIDPTIDYTEDAVVAAVTARMTSAIVASCTCQTKTPVISYHAEDCRYRALVEGLAVIIAFQKREQERALDAKGDALDRGL